MMHMEKRGQELFGLPFVFIISLFVAALIVIFAIFTIKNFTCRGEQAQISLFVADLKAEIEKAFFTTFGSQTVFEGNLPKGGCSGIELVCFALPSAVKDVPSTSVDDVWFEISAYRNQDVQLFFYPSQGLQEVGVQQAFNVNPSGASVDITENPTCFQNTGKIRILLKNNGERILIQK